MNSTPQTDNCFLRSDHPHVGQQCGEALKRYLGERGYAKQTVGRYLSCTAHFFRWVERSRLDVRRINEKAIDHFLDDHLSHCDCGWSTRSDRGESHAALGHLLLVLRTLGMAEARHREVQPASARCATGGIWRLQRFQKFNDRFLIAMIEPLKVLGHNACFAAVAEDGLSHRQ